MSTGTNPFASAELWDPLKPPPEPEDGPRLREGEYVVRILRVAEQTSQNGNPKAVFDMANQQGSTRFFCPYSDSFLQKIAAVFEAAGVPLPVEGEYNPNDRCRIRLDVLQRLEGKDVGVVIRPEPDQNDPSKTWDRVQGCVHPSRITSGADARGLPPAGQQAAAGNGQTAAVPQQQDTRPLPF